MSSCIFISRLFHCLLQRPKDFRINSKRVPQLSNPIHNWKKICQWSQIVQILASVQRVAAMQLADVGRLMDEMKSSTNLKLVILKYPWQMGVSENTLPDDTIRNLMAIWSYMDYQWVYHGLSMHLIIFPTGKPMDWLCLSNLNRKPMGFYHEI